MRPTGDVKKGNHVVGGCKASTSHRRADREPPGRGVPGIRAGWARADRPGVASRPRRGWTTLRLLSKTCSNNDARFIELGSDYYESRVNLNRRTRNHVRELQALGYKVTLEPAA